MFEVARDFPETSFAWGTAIDTGEDEGLENVFAYEANAQEGGYVNGVIAAMLSEADVLGIVGPVEAGDAKLYIDGFVAGAKSANPYATVNVSYTGSFGDTALAAEAALVDTQDTYEILDQPAVVPQHVAVDPQMRVGESGLVEGAFAGGLDPEEDYHAVAVLRLNKGLASDRQPAPSAQQSNDDPGQNIGGVVHAQENPGKS